MLCLYLLVFVPLAFSQFVILTPVGEFMDLLCYRRLHVFGSYFGDQQCDTLGSLKMSLYSLKHPSHAFSQVKTQKFVSQQRVAPLLAMPPSSIFIHKSKVSGSSSESSGLLLTEAHTVGIIGGISVNSTLNFLNKLVEWSSRDGKDCLPFILCSDPLLNKELLWHGRNSFQSFGRKNDCYELDYAPIIENLQNKRTFLEQSGAQCTVMPCHISHCWHDEVSKGCSVPFLHVGKCVARELKQAKLKPLEAGSPLRIGVLGTNFILNAGIYQEKLQNEGFEVVLPDKATMEHIVNPAVEALNRRDLEGAQNLLRIALQVLLVRAVSTVILASDDMSNLLPWDDPLLAKCIDPMDALARATIRWAEPAEQESCKS